jgi:hypothetical protein
MEEQQWQPVGRVAWTAAIGHDTAPVEALLQALDVIFEGPVAKILVCGFRWKPAAHSDAKPASIPI